MNTHTPQLWASLQSDPAGPSLGVLRETCQAPLGRIFIKIVAPGRVTAGSCEAVYELGQERQLRGAWLGDQTGHSGN